MAEKQNISNEWFSLLKSSLKSNSVTGRLLALEFLGNQISFEFEQVKELMPLINENVLFSDTNVRYFARKAREHFYDTYPDLHNTVEPNKSLKLDIKDGEPLTAQQILLHKLKLGSRYVVFDAIERLTESKDPSLVTSFVEYLAEEKDEYKISYLVKRICRFDDPRIPGIVEKYLDHEDPRIVANALEGLCLHNTPELSDKLIDFATSQDNRIRANAILGLYKYEPLIAEKHIEEMMNSNKIALQDSAIFLLKKLRPTNLGEMLKIAQHSKFATVRLKSLDIMPPTEEESHKSIDEPEEQIEKSDPKRDFMIMFVMFASCVGMLFISNLQSRQLIALLFAAIAALTMLMPDKTRLSLQKITLSIGFISSLVWGSSKLMVLPAIMGVWLSWSSCSDNKSEEDSEPYISNISLAYSWLFVVCSVIISQFIQGKFESIISLISILIDDKTKIAAEITDLVSRQNNFNIIMLAFISIMTIIILRFNSWFPPKDENVKPERRLLKGVAVALLLVIVINLSHMAGIKLQLKLQGKKISDIAGAVINTDASETNIKDASKK